MRNIFICDQDGDCDFCKYKDCIASEQQALKFYGREEKACRERYGRGLKEDRKQLWEILADREEMNQKLTDTHGQARGVAVKAVTLCE